MAANNCKTQKFGSSMDFLTSAVHSSNKTAAACQPHTPSRNSSHTSRSHNSLPVRAPVRQPNTSCSLLLLLLLQYLCVLLVGIVLLEKLLLREPARGLAGLLEHEQSWRQKIVRCQLRLDLSVTHGWCHLCTMSMSTGLVEQAIAQPMSTSFG